MLDQQSRQLLLQIQKYPMVQLNGPLRDPMRLLFYKTKANNKHNFDIKTKISKPMFQVILL